MDPASGLTSSGSQISEEKRSPILTNACKGAILFVNWTIGFNPSFEVHWIGTDIFWSQ